MISLELEYLIARVKTKLAMIPTHTYSNGVSYDMNDNIRVVIYKEKFFTLTVYYHTETEISILDNYTSLDSYDIFCEIKDMIDFEIYGGIKKHEEWKHR